MIDDTDSCEIITREALERAYEDACGLDARRGAVRIDYLEKWIKKNRIKSFIIFDDTKKMRRDYRKGKSWYSGKEHGNTICLGYTSGPGAFVYKNAIFAQILIGE
jgi:hypothetical protein